MPQPTFSRVDTVSSPRLGQVDLEALDEQRDDQHHRRNNSTDTADPSPISTR